MRLADQPRGENRTIINRLYNGDPPFDEATAEENQIQINRNDLEGVNAMSQARRQWMQAFLRPGNNFSVSYDSGPPRKRREWAHSVTRHCNRVLKRSRNYMEQNRGTGANVMLHGPGPVLWKDRRSPVPRVLPISSVMIPSETDIDFDNLSYIAFFQEWTPAQLYSLTHGDLVDPGWNMPLVQAQWKYVSEQYQKQPNATAFQYMPERIEELIKQDMGMWGSDAVPTIDVWDFYFREGEDGDGWYRRVFLDWGVAQSEVYGYKDKMPDSRNKVGGKFLGTDKDGRGGFLYSSGKRMFAKSLNEFFHCQHGDCSAVAPFKYHSERSLGWMLWGVCDLENRLHCKFSEALFESLMWFFRVANNEQLTRLRKADFLNMGVIPNGVEMLKAADRYTPDAQLTTMGFARFKQLISQNSPAFTQDFDKGDTGKEMTATETMARVNVTNALVSGLLSLAYFYEEFKDREVLRRLCVKNNPHPMARKFRKGCLEDGVPPEMLDVERMDVSRERALGGGNKTLEMAQVQFLQGIRKNLGPDGQRRVDHISIESATDDANLAEDLAPLDDQKIVTNSMHDAQLATDRLMRGLPFSERPEMVYEDYVKVWIADLTLLIQKNVQNGNMATMEQIAGYQNVGQEIAKFLKIMSSDPEDKDRVQKHAKDLNALMKLVKGFAQRLQQQMKAAAKQGAGGPDPKAAAAAQSTMMLAGVKAKVTADKAAQSQAQKQIAFDLKEQRAEREHHATLRRMQTEHSLDLLTGHIERLAELSGPEGNGKPENQ
jgi:hypothetical protein